jgi:hypothetical protein
MSWMEVLPEGDPPRVSPAVRLLVEQPCNRCHGTRMRLEGMWQQGEPDLMSGAFPCEPPGEHPADFESLEVEGGQQQVPVRARLRVSVLCSDCGQLEDRHGWQPTV